MDELQGNLTNQGGTLSPGNSPGLTEILGDYDQQNTGELLIELAGLNAASEFDQVQVSGTATLGGLLDIDLLDGFTPSAGNSFDILVATTISGTFSSVDLPALQSGLNWYLQYNLSPTGNDTVTLTAAGPVPAAAWLFGSALGLMGVMRRKLTG